MPSRVIRRSVAGLTSNRTSAGKARCFNALASFVNGVKWACIGSLFISLTCGFCHGSLSASNEIRLYNETESAPILAKQLNARSVEIRGEAIKTLGKLKYKEVEPKLIEMYNVQPEEVKRQIISAIADLKTDKALGFLYNAYDEADNWGTKRVILKALYEYSAMGRKTFDQLERKADSHTAILFAHTKHPLINQLN